MKEMKNFMLKGLHKFDKEQNEFDEDEEKVDLEAKLISTLVDIKRPKKKKKK